MRYLHKFNDFKLNENVDDDLKKAIHDKKDFISSYFEILKAHKKAEKTKTLPAIEGKLKSAFLDIIKKYDINTLQQFNDYVEKLTKDRNFISLKRDFSDENKVYLNYFLENKKEPAKSTEVTAKSTPTTSAPVTPTKESSWDEFNKKWVKTINYIKTEGVKIGLPILKISDMNFLYKTKKDLVSFVQDFLNLNNKAVLDIDGKYGIETSKEVKKFQVNNKITPDGSVGPVTFERIMETSGNPVKGLKVLKTEKKKPDYSKMSNYSDTSVKPAISNVMKEDAQIVKNITDVFQVAFGDDILSNSNYNDIFGFYKYYATDFTTDFNEEKWLDVFKSMNPKDLYYFVYFYNNAKHFYKGSVIKFDFVADSAEGFDDEEMQQLSDIMEQKGIKVSGTKVSPNGK